MADIAEEIGVSERTCHRWLKAACLTQPVQPEVTATPVYNPKAIAFAMKASGHGVKKIAADLKISKRTCYRWLQRGTVPEDPKARPWQKRLSHSQSKELKAFFSKYPSASLEDGMHMVRDCFGVTVSPNTARRYRTTHSKTTGLKRALMEVFEEDVEATAKEVVNLIKTKHSIDVSVYTVLRYQERLFVILSGTTTTFWPIT